MERKKTVSTKREGPSPVRFSEAEKALIAKIQKAALPQKVSVNYIVNRAIGYAGPLLLKGEVPLVESMSIGGK